VGIVIARESGIQYFRDVSMKLRSRSVQDCPVPGRDLKGPAEALAKAASRALTSEVGKNKKAGAITSRRLWQF